jgi:hypothetical protein
MDMETGTEAAQFPEKKYINWIFVAVYLFPILTPKSFVGEQRSRNSGHNVK